ncbi:MAG: hypothetical protein IJP04_10970, partial [Clostridia bacterium]|nr:hypothetical protein [Clostridia bacterium]
SAIHFFISHSLLQSFHQLRQNEINISRGKGIVNKTQRPSEDVRQARKEQEPTCFQADSLKNMDD